MESWRPVHTSPPPLKYPYDPSDPLSDIPGLMYAAQLFLDSKMLECEAYCEESDEKRERLYFTVGFGTLQCLKGLISYADEDLLAAIEHMKHGNSVANQYRKKTGLVGSILGSTGLKSQAATLRGMTDIERHAELLYAVSLVVKALVGVVYSGDWLAFVKEALNIRSAISILHELYVFVEGADAAYAKSLFASSASSSSSSLAESTSSSSSSSSDSNSTSSFSTAASTPSATRGGGQAQNKRPVEDPSIDQHFRSGVYVGAGLGHLMLSMLPARLQSVIEIFGYRGDRQKALELLMRVGGWDTEGEEPLVNTENEGLFRPAVDLVLIVFHLVLCDFTSEGVDIKVASRVVEWNRKRYPTGVLFLFTAGRLALQQTQPRKAIENYVTAMQVQQQYRNLHHVSFWEIAMARLSLWEIGEGSSQDNFGGDGAKINGDVSGSAGCWRVLEQEATWSKCIYTYGLAVCLLEDWETDSKDSTGKKKKERVKEACILMAKVPDLRQKIAGKSIPVEKLAARKARKFILQNNRLILPALELGYIFNTIPHTPRGVIVKKMLPEVWKVLRKLALYGPGTGVSLNMENSFMAFDFERNGDAKMDKVAKKGVNGKIARLGGELGPAKYEGGAHEYWDDLALARFLEGVCLRFVAYPDQDAVISLEENVEISREEAERGAEAAFRAVLEYGPRIELDHYLVYHAHFELGRLFVCQGNMKAAKVEFELVLSGKYLEVGSSGKKGKYSMENKLHMRTQAALDLLHSIYKT